jgi:hypothetical protein
MRQRKQTRRQAKRQRKQRGGIAPELLYAGLGVLGAGLGAYGLYHTLYPVYVLNKTKQELFPPELPKFPRIETPAPVNWAVPALPNSNNNLITRKNRK